MVCWCIPGEGAPGGIGGRGRGAGATPCCCCEGTDPSKGTIILPDHLPFVLAMIVSEQGVPRGGRESQQCHPSCLVSHRRLAAKGTRKEYVTVRLSMYQVG